MQTTLNMLRLRDLLSNLHELTQLQISLHDISGREVYSILSRSAFCDLICDSHDGYLRCVASDAAAIHSLNLQAGPLQYRCHTGLIESAIPITDGGKMVAVILFGQILDTGPIDVQWEHTKALCAWHPEQQKLHDAFHALPRLSASQIRACYEIINACVSEMRLEGLMRSSMQTDAQRLLSYIHSHYASPLTLTALSRALSISKTRMCQLAKQIEPDATITSLITKRRIAAAQKLLQKKGATIADVAELVGIPDYNYFTKVFKKETGMTPSAYKAKHKNP